MLHDKPGEEDDQKNLRQLRWLEVCKSHIDPSLCPVYRLTDHQHQCQHAHRQQVQDPIKIGNPHVVDQGDYHHEDDSQHKTRDLPSLVGLVSAAYDKNAKAGNGQHKDHKGKFIVF